MPRPAPPSGLAAHFSHNARERGDEYLRYGQVEILRADRRGVHAEVMGNEPYDVVLTLERKTLIASCSCPHFLDGNACKHVWATIGAAQRRGFYRDPEPGGFELDWAAVDDADPGLDQGDSDADEVPAWNDLVRSTPRAVVPAGEWGLTAPVAVAAKRPPPMPAKPRTWRDDLQDARKLTPAAAVPALVPSDQRVHYLLGAAPQGQPLTVTYCAVERKTGGDWGKLKANGAVVLVAREDREVLGIIRGCPAYSNPYGMGEGVVSLGIPVHVPDTLIPVLLPTVCRTGRCHLSADEGLGPPLAWDDAAPWELAVVGELDPTAENLLVRGELRRAAERVAIGTAALIVPGAVVVDGRVGRLSALEAFHWIRLLQQHSTVTVPMNELDALVTETLASSGGLTLDLPDGLRWDTTAETPRPRAIIGSPGPFDYPRDRLRLHLSFDYESTNLPWYDARRAAVLAARRVVMMRDREREHEAIEVLAEAGVRRSAYADREAPCFEFPQKRLGAVVRGLVGRGWAVEADGRAYRSPQRFDITVSAAIDWFDVEGGAVFDDQTVPLPALLAAARRGDDTVALGDGTVGLLPEDWLARHGLLASCGEAVGDTLRFRRSQVWLLDQLLADQPAVTIDETFARARAELQAFEGVRAADPSPTFVGELRPYQREGLGWLEFLERFGFGGCLADDMGLGKTVQVLAHLENRHATGRASGPSLIVVPKSLVFNWKAEAERFAPRLRLLDFTGPARTRQDARLDAHDVVVTTYGTLRRDVARLKDTSFDYVVLDEAHAIKNAASASAKAVRLLVAQHRLALTGTPVQNHLGELWSLFEFLNPGMLGAKRVFSQADAGFGHDGSAQSLARAVRPFLLRRTKDAVAPDLPARIEQTVYCEIEGHQRALYDELRDHYRTSLRARIDRQGMAKARMHVLEALLRLRQAACHPGLVDPAHADGESAKLDVLIDRLAEVVAEGRKALVFSQFTTFLDLLRVRLDAQQVTYEYLDGKTTDRDVRVRRFQADPESRLFLISLKAGGLGLNLTAADAVFLLDPWWNPAIEAQAIDRAHRIGQTRKVFACRLIARDTVEEKILQLQERKRELADSILAADGGLIGELTREDLELLLG